MENIVRVGVGVYIFNQERQVLLGQRKSVHGFGCWCPPGGHLEFGETNEQAAVREVKEETNLDIREDDLSLRGVTNDFYAETRKHYVTLHFFCTRFAGTPQVMEKDKCACWKWFDVNNLPENLLLSNQNFIKKHSLGRL